jgi:DNA-binding NtrC family response regulator
LESRSLYELCKAFRHLGYRTFGATSFSDAKRLLIGEHPEVLVADVRLGEFNGIQLLLLAKELRPGIAAVITNAFADSVLAAETQRMGGTFMVKPIDVGELLETIRVRSNPVDVINRRSGERRLLYMPNYSPERRVSDRRRQ